MQSKTSVGEALDRSAIYDQVEQAKRLARTALIYLRRPAGILALFAIAMTTVGILYLLASHELAATDARIDESRALLARPAPDLETLERTLQGWQDSRNFALAGKISRPVDARILADLMAAAQEAGVQVFSAGVRDDTVLALPTGEYRATPAFIKATGGLPAIQQFLALLESGDGGPVQLDNSTISESGLEFSVEIEITALSEFPGAAAGGPDGPAYVPGPQSRPVNLSGGNDTAGTAP